MTSPQETLLSDSTARDASHFQKSQCQMYYPVKEQPKCNLTFIKDYCPVLVVPLQDKSV